MGFVKIENEPTRLKITVENDIFYQGKENVSASTDGDNLVLSSITGGEILSEPFYNFLAPEYNVDHHSVRELLEIILGYLDYIGVPPTPGAVDKHYTHVQGTPLILWEVEHNLEKKPSVTIVDSADTDIIGEIIYIDNNNLQLHFSAAFSGRAYLN